MPVQFAETANIVVVETPMTPSMITEPEFDDRCSDCGTDESQLYYISDTRAVCACSPLYPDLRPSDYPNKPCSCDLVKYQYLGETICICSCSSPDLYALLERQHELLSDNEEQDIPF